MDTVPFACEQFFRIQGGPLDCQKVTGHQREPWVTRGVPPPPFKSISGNRCRGLRKILSELISRGAHADTTAFTNNLFGEGERATILSAVLGAVAISRSLEYAAVVSDEMVPCILQVASGVEGVRDELSFDPWIKNCSREGVDVVCLRCEVASCLGHVSGDFLEQFLVDAVMADIDQLKDMVHEEEDQTNRR